MDQPGVNRLLAAFGAALLTVATFALFFHENPALSGTFVFLGAALLVVSVFERRMVGPQKFSAGGLTINLTDVQVAIDATESQLKSGATIPVDEVIQ